MARSGSVFKSINLLCTIFEDIGAPKWSPETFRMAKFNESKSVCPMWIVLRNLVFVLEILRKRRLPLFSTEGKPQTQPLNSAARTNTVAALYRYGYRRLPLYCDTEQLCSRELLFAFGWLIKESCFFTLVRSAYIAVIDAEDVLHEPCLHLPDHQIREAVNVLQCGQNATFPPHCFFHEKNADSLLSLHQQVTYSNRTSLSSSLASIRYAHSLHKHTFNASKLTTDLENVINCPHLTVEDVFLLHNPKLLEEHSRILEKCLQGLMNLLEWKRMHEGVFWEWMNSVIDLSLSANDDTSNDSNLSDPEAMKLPKSPLLPFEELLKRTSQCWSITKDDYSRMQSTPNATVLPQDSIAPGDNLYQTHLTPDATYIPHSLLKCLPADKHTHLTELTGKLNIQLDALREEVKKLHQKAETELDQFCLSFIPTVIACKQKQSLHK